MSKHMFEIELGRLIVHGVPNTAIRITMSSRVWALSGSSALLLWSTQR
jgi:hypothetical protein